MKQLKAYLLLMIAIAIGCPLSYGASENNSFKSELQLSADSLDLMSKEPYMVPYVKYLMKADVHWEYADRWYYTLVFIDDDKIPEMIIQSDNYNAVDALVLSQNDGIVSSLVVLKEVKYIEKKGLLKNYWSNMGGTTDRVFRLNNGLFELTATMRGEENLDFDNPDVSYYFNDVKVDEDTAERLLKEAFEDKGKAINIDELEWLDWKDLLKNKESIKGWK